MATFRVGQRVKLVSVQAPELADNIGAVGTFDGYVEDTLEFEEPIDCAVVWDGRGRFLEGSCHIAPLQPERNQIVAWEDCPIDPRNIKETA